MSYPVPHPPVAPRTAVSPAYGAPYGAPRPAAPRGTGPGAPAGGAYAQQAARYREAELASASPGQLVVMLFDKIVLTVRRARTAMDARDIEQRTEQILKASEMIGELRLSLDHEQGGEIATQLDALYAFALRELFDANRHQDGAKLDVVLRICAELREAFAGAQAQLQAQAAAGGALQVRSA